jgi:hypothetical protein
MLAELVAWAMALMFKRYVPAVAKTILLPSKLTPELIFGLCEANVTAVGPLPIDADEASKIVVR